MQVSNQNYTTSSGKKICSALFQCLHCHSNYTRRLQEYDLQNKKATSFSKNFVAGINQLIFHGFPYTHPEIQYPNYNPWGQVASNLNRHNPFWNYFPLMNAYIARGQYLMQQGTTQCHIAIFHHQNNYSYKFLHEEDLVRGHLPGFDPKPPRNIMGIRVTRIIPNNWVLAKLLVIFILPNPK